MADEPHPLEIPEFLKIPQAQRNAAWEKHRVTVKPASAATSAGDDWRKERNKAYEEAARKDPSRGDPEPKS